MASPICTVAVEGPDLPTRDFDRRYRSAHQPVVIRNATVSSSAAFRALTTIPALLEAFGSARVTLSSANAHSYGRKKVDLATYLAAALGDEAKAAWAVAADDDEAAARQFYWFGEHGEELASLTSRYPLPRYARPGALLAFATFDADARGSEGGGGGGGDPTAVTPPLSHQPALSFGVGPDGSGVPFHFHADGFSEVLHGSKHWLLYRDQPPRFRANATSVSWLKHDYPLLRPSERPLECTIWPGDLLYFPHGWYHAIVNRGDPTVFMSTFL